ncbi:MAG: dihydroorotate dehydrogenase electron transfer subunit [Gaiellales bacterium]|nr:MAG: dihydroorotate dehydrogenase electron transfer subunit [Gaiellales bacterium]
MGAPGRAEAAYSACRVIESRPVGAYRLVSFIAREMAAGARPGQFLMVRRSGPALDPLLPRPMSIHDVESDLVKVLIDPVGKGTLNLAAAGVGDQFNVLGPLGNGFNLEGDGPALLAGGGIGAAPLAYLARQLMDRGREVTCLLGFRSRAQAIAAELFRGVDVHVSTEDGSVGRQGLVSELLSGCIAGLGPGARQAELFACGPDAMLRAVSATALECGVRSQVSVDTHMACGVGACQGCVVETVQGYRRACSEGPVFAAADLKW